MNDFLREHSARSHATVYDSIDALCGSFVSAWESGGTPEMSAYLDQVGEESRPTLLRNLLDHELRRRRDRGEAPATEWYIQRYPQYAEIIRQVFIESSGALNFDADRTMSVRRGSPGLRTPKVNRLGDYRLLHELGRGGMGVVFEALNVRRGNQVALKTLPLADGAALHRFKREFRSVADLNHPNLIGLHKLEADGGQWFFTMDLVEGTDFLGYVRPSGVLDEARLRSALAQLVSGVMALHGAGVIHRDLKPSNVMVTHGGRVVVLDFGLVMDMEQSLGSHTGGNIIGTPAYMAPEQATAAQVTAASDWYAVGVMLYESLCGTKPFQGNGFELIQNKLTTTAAPLPDDPAIPADLASLCLRLLVRDPEQRPKTLEIAKTTAISAETMTSSTASAHGSRLLGREHHLAALQEVYKAFRKSAEPQTVFILARSGEGKTTLAEHFLQTLREDKGLVVMAGRCYDRESVPFKAIDALIDALASYLKALPETDAALLMPDDIEVLAQVFPVLQRVGFVARRMESNGYTATDEQQTRQRAFGALRLLLSRISRRSPIVWFVDDLQWGDTDSAEALFETLRPSKAPHVLLLGTYRSDEAEGSAFLNSWKEIQRKNDVKFATKEVTLAPLTVEQCTELVVQLLGNDTEAIRRRAIEFARETQGNPFLLTELVGCFDPESDSFEPIPLHEVLARKLSRLPEEAGQILDVVAVAGQALALEEATRTAGHELPPVSTITRMINERLVRLIGPEESPVVDTYHDRVRETVLSEMDKGREKTLHLALADFIETSGGGLTSEQIAGLVEGRIRDQTKAILRIYDLVYHYDAAGEKRKAWQYGLLAAEQARRQSALEVAVINYTLAIRNLDEPSKNLRYAIAEGYGLTHMLLGRYDAASDQFTQAMDLVDDIDRKAHIDALLSEVAFKQGLIAKSLSISERGLRRLGVWVPRSPLGLCWGLIRETTVQGMHSLFPSRLHRKLPNTRGNLVIDLFRRASHPLVFSNTPKLMWAHLAELNRSEEIPISAHMVMCYAINSGLSSMLGWGSRGDRYGVRSMTLAHQFDDVLVQGYCKNYRGIGLYASARYEEGRTQLTEAIQDFEKAGDLYELHLAHFHRGCCQMGLGNLAEAVEEARSTFTSSTRLGDSRTLCSSYLWARATRGNIPFPDLKGCYPFRPDDVMSTVHGIMAEGHWHTFHGRTAEALGTFERANSMVWKSLCANSHTILVLPNLAGAVRRHADAVEQSDPQLCKRLRRRGDKLSRWAARITTLFPAAYPIALRERSLMLAAIGKTKRALKVAEKSCALARKQQAKYELALSERVAAQIRVKLNIPGADDELTKAEARVSEIEKQVQTGDADKAAGS